MMQSQFKKYTILLIFVTLAPLILLGGFNWFVDPYDIYNSPKIDGFNALKPEISSHIRLMKAYAAQHIKPEAICLGTSSVEIGIDPSHEGWSYAPVYNLGIPSANIYEMLRYFQHYHNVHPLRQVILCLDFFSFQSNIKNAEDFNEQRLSVDYDGQKNSFIANNEIIPLMFSIDALVSSLNTISHQTNAPIFHNGMLRLVLDLKAIGGQRAHFLTGEKPSATTHYLPESYQFDNLNFSHSPLTYYRKLLQIAYEDGIDMRIVISPYHVRNWEVLAAAGSWPKFEEWKRALVTINEEEARHFGKPPFPFWDFSIYNEYTTEPVPALGDMETEMHWYRDSSHYKKELGDLMLDRIFNYHGSNRVVSDDFGVLLNSENIDSHLQKIRSDRQHYHDTHPEDIAEIENLFK